MTSAVATSAAYGRQETRCCGLATAVVGPLPRIVRLLFAIVANTLDVVFQNGHALRERDVIVAQMRNDH